MNQRSGTTKGGKTNEGKAKTSSKEKRTKKLKQNFLPFNYVPTLAMPTQLETSQQVRQIPYKESYQVSAKRFIRVSWTPEAIYECSSRICTIQFSVVYHMRLTSGFKKSTKEEWVPGRFKPISHCYEVKLRKPVMKVLSIIMTEHLRMQIGG